MKQKRINLIDKVKGVSDLIQPGDRVDVIAVAARVGSETPAASAILRGALVLALGSTLDSAAPATATTPDTQTVATVTLGVTPAQANLLAMADINATLRLSLRSPRESVNSLTSQPLVLPQAQVQRAAPPMQTLTPPVAAVAALAPGVPAAAPAAKAAASAAASTGVQVIYGNDGPQ
ncbi:MAG: Flp pilus assembly protein CpaB [Candidatus Baltobacteraceae bacterium]